MKSQVPWAGPLHYDKRVNWDFRYSMSLDGGILGSIGVNNAQGGLYSKLLQENDAVVVTDAAVYDNPVLLCSEPGAKQPLRVILARSIS